MGQNKSNTATANARLNINTSNTGVPGTLTHLADFQNLQTLKGETYSVSYFGTKNSSGVATAITQAVVFQKNSTANTRFFSTIINCLYI